MTYRKVIENVRKGVKRGMTANLKRLGVETNPDQMLYNSLSAEDFSALSKMFGEENMMEYIHQMEANKLKGKVR